MWGESPLAPTHGQDPRKPPASRATLSSFHPGFAEHLLCGRPGWGDGWALIVTTVRWTRPGSLGGKRVPGRSSFQAGVRLQARSESWADVSLW